MITINMQYFGGNGAASGKSGGGRASGGGKSAAEIQAEIDEKRATEAIHVSARWNGIERKVTYSTSFTNAEGKSEPLYGFISKSALTQEMKELGATPEQIKKAKAELKKINPAYYKR